MGFEVLFATLLNALLAKCVSQVSSETPQEYCKAHYNAVTGRMDPDVVEECIPEARRAALKARRQVSKSERKDIPKLSRQDLYDRCEKQLIAAMTATPEQVAACMATAAELGDDT